MFRCQLCSCVVPPRTRVRRLVLKRRTRQYPARSRVNLVVRDGKKYHTDDPGGEGHEVAREVLVCPACARRQGAT
jgi:hypothetical protein